MVQLANFLSVAREKVAYTKNALGIKAAAFVRNTMSSAQLTSQLSLNFRKRSKSKEPLRLQSSASEPMDRWASSIKKLNHIQRLDPKRDLRKKMYVINPSSQYRVSWDLFLGMLIIYSVIVIPVRIGFSQVVSARVVVVDCVIDTIFLLDICINFRTAYLDETETLVYDLDRIRRHYIKGWFFIDVFSTIPIDLIVEQLLGGGSELRSLKLLKTLRLARLLKLARLTKLSKLFHALEHNLEVNRSFLRLVILFFHLLFVAHVLACAWWWLGANQMEGPSWAADYQVEDSKLWTQYVSSLYWSVATMTAVGYGDIKALTDLERIYCILTQVVGACVFGFLIGNISTLLDTMDIRTACYKARMTELREWMTDRKLPLLMQQKIKRYFEHYLKRKSVFDETTILSELSHNLRNRVVMQSHRSFINKVYLFEKQDPSFVTAVVLRMKPFVREAGAVVAHQGEIAQEMYILSQGTVSVYVTRGGVEISVGTLSNGAHFGEISVLLQKGRVASVRTTSYCDVCSISKEDLDIIFSHYPAARDDLVKLANSRISGLADAMGYIDSEPPEMKALIEDAKSMHASRLEMASKAQPNILELSKQISNNAKANAQEAVASAGKAVQSIQRKISFTDHDRKADPAWSGAEDEDGSSATKKGRDSKDSKDEKEEFTLAVEPVEEILPQLDISDVDMFVIASLDSVGEIISPRSRLIKMQGYDHRKMSVRIAHETSFERQQKDTDKRSTWIITPANPNMQRWDVLIAALIVYSVIVVPYRIGFDQPAVKGMLVFELLIDLCFGIDIIMNFRLGYYRDDLSIETQAWPLAKRYLSGWFTLDFFTTVPFDWIAKSAGGGQAVENEGDVMQYLKLLRVLRLARLFKLMHVSKWINMLEDDLELVNPAAIQLMKLLLQVTLIAHLMACGWYWISKYAEDDAQCINTCPFNETTGVFETCQIPFECAWVVEQNSNLLSVSQNYLASCYWAFTTMSTVGYGDVLAGTDSERLYATCMMLVGVTVFGYVIGNLAGLVSKITEPGQRQKAKMQEVREYMKEQALPKDVQMRVNKYYEHYLTRKSLFDEEGILMDMRPRLRQEVLLYLNRDIVRKMRFFHHQPETFVSHVLSLMNMQFYVPGDMIYTMGDDAKEMFFLVRGNMEVVVCDEEGEDDGADDVSPNAYPHRSEEFEMEDGSQFGSKKESSITAVLEEGSVFGELGVLVTCKRGHSVRAATHAAVLAMHRDQLDELSNRYPNMAHKLKNLAFSLTSKEELARLDSNVQEEVRELTQMLQSQPSNASTVSDGRRASNGDLSWALEMLNKTMGDSTDSNRRTSKEVDREAAGPKSGQNGESSGRGLSLEQLDGVVMHRSDGSEENDALAEELSEVPLPGSRSPDPGNPESRSPQRVQGELANGGEGADSKKSNSSQQALESNTENQAGLGDEYVGSPRWLVENDITEGCSTSQGPQENNGGNASTSTSQGGHASSSPSSPSQVLPSSAEVGVGLGAVTTQKKADADYHHELQAKQKKITGQMLVTSRGWGSKKDELKANVVDACQDTRSVQALKSIKTTPISQR